MKISFLIFCGLLQILFVNFFSVCGQSFETVKFTDNSELSLPVNHVADEKLNSRKITSFKVLKKQAIFVYDSVNKAGFSILPGKLTTNILAKNRTLFNRIDKISTSYALIQDGTTFSIDGFEPLKIPSPSDCDNCRITANLVLFEIKLSDSIYYIPFVESIKMLKED